MNDSVQFRRGASEADERGSQHGSRRTTDEFSLASASLSERRNRRDQLVVEALMVARRRHTSFRSPTSEDVVPVDPFSSSSAYVTSPRQSGYCRSRDSCEPSSSSLRSSELLGAGPCADSGRDLSIVVEDPESLAYIEDLEATVGVPCGADHL